MNGDEMAVDGYYVVAGIARHQYKQGWKFLALWNGYGLSEANLGADLYGQMGVPTPSFVPTLWRTTRDSY